MAVSFEVNLKKKKTSNIRNKSSLLWRVPTFFSFQNFPQKKLPTKKLIFEAPWIFSHPIYNFASQANQLQLEYQKVGRSPNTRCKLLFEVKPSPLTWRPKGWKKTHRGKCGNCRDPLKDGGASPVGAHLKGIDIPSKYLLGVWCIEGWLLRVPHPKVTGTTNFSTKKITEDSFESLEFSWKKACHWLFKIYKGLVQV